MCLLTQQHEMKMRQDPMQECDVRSRDSQKLAESNMSCRFPFFAQYCPPCLEIIALQRSKSVRPLFK